MISPKGGTKLNPWVFSIIVTQPKVHGKQFNLPRLELPQLQGPFFFPLRRKILKAIIGYNTARDISVHIRNSYLYFLQKKVTYVVVCRVWEESERYMAESIFCCTSKAMFFAAATEHPVHNNILILGVIDWLRVKMADSSSNQGYSIAKRGLEGAFSDDVKPSRAGDEGFSKQIWNTCWL